MADNKDTLYSDLLKWQKENFWLVEPEEGRPSPNPFEQDPIKTKWDTITQKNIRIRRAPPIRPLTFLEGFRQTATEPQTFLERLRQTRSVLGGRKRTVYKYPDGNLFIDQGKIGILGYLLAEPLRLAFNLIKVPFFLLCVAGIYAWDGAKILFKRTENRPLARVITSPIWLLLGMSAVVLVGPGLLGYGIVKAISEGTDFLMQKAVLPALSRLVTYTILFPFVGLAHLIIKPKEESQNVAGQKANNTNANMTREMQNNLSNPNQMQLDLDEGHDDDTSLKDKRINQPEPGKPSTNGKFAPSSRPLVSQGKPNLNQPIAPPTGNKNSNRKS